MAKDKTEAGKTGATTAAAASAPAEASAARPKLRYQDIPDLHETFADSIGQWIFDGQMLRIEFTVTRLDPGSSPPTSGRRVPTARVVLTPGCAVELIRQSQQLLAALEKAAASAQQAAAGKGAEPAGRG